MLKSRVIAAVLVKDGWAVQSIGFRRFLPIGRPEIIAESFDRYGADEIALLDISATRARRGPDVEMVARCTKKCHVPVAVGGGVSTVQQMHELLRNGADKIVINTAAVDNPRLIEDGASLFGSQCMVAALDARRREDGIYEIRTHCGACPRDITPASAASVAEARGAGEILLNSIDRDGSKEGYDLALLSSVRDHVRIPLIVMGGVGHPRHLAEGLRAGADAAAAGNFFSFTEHSVSLAKRNIAADASLRRDSYASYDNAVFDELGRLGRQPEDILDDLLFVRIEEEVI